MLAGQAADQAGKVRVAGQELVPEALVAQFADAVQAVAAAVVQGRAEGRLAGATPSSRASALAQ